MGHLANPLSFRLSKSKFWFSNWNNYNKKNYKKYFLEDFNSFLFFKWLLTFFNYKKVGYKILDINLIKNFKIFIYNISIIFDDDFIIDVLRSNDIIYKNFYYNSLFFKLFCDKGKNIYKTGNKKKLYNFFLNTKKKREKYNKIYIKLYFEFKKKFSFLKKNKFFLYIFKKKINFFFKDIFKKKKKKVIFFKFFQKKLINFKKSYFINYFFLKNLMNKFSNCNQIKYSKNIFSYILKYKLVFQKFFLFKILPIKNILIIFKKYLEYFLHKIFRIKKIWINFFDKNSYRNSSLYIKRFIKHEVYKKGFRINHIINLIKKDLIHDVSILGFKLGFFGRYQKKLRNKDFYRIKGSLAPSNINSVISYANFVILLKQGIAGVEICTIKKMKKNEIF